MLRWRGVPRTIQHQPLTNHKPLILSPWIPITSLEPWNLESDRYMDAPVRFENRAQLICLLTKAAELEHGIMCCYLFSAFSIKKDVS